MRRRWLLRYWTPNESSCIPSSCFLGLRLGYVGSNPVDTFFFFNLFLLFFCFWSSLVLYQQSRWPIQEDNIQQKATISECGRKVRPNSKGIFSFFSLLPFSLFLFLSFFLLLTVYCSHQSVLRIVWREPLVRVEVSECKSKIESGRALSNGI